MIKVGKREEVFKTSGKVIIFSFSTLIGNKKTQTLKLHEGLPWWHSG